MIHVRVKLNWVNSNKEDISGTESLKSIRKADNKRTMKTNSDIAFSLVEELKFYIKSQNILFLEIGRVLKTMRDQEVYKTLGHDTWTSFLASGELSIKPSTAYAYIEIFEVYVLQFKINKEDLADIPYDKLRIALPTARKMEGQEEITELVAKAKELSRSDLMKELGQMPEMGFSQGKMVYIVQCSKCKKFIKSDIEFCIGHNI